MAKFVALARDDRVDAWEIAYVINQYQAFTARLLIIANSLYDGRDRAVMTVRQAAGDVVDPLARREKRERRTDFSHQYRLRCVAGIFNSVKEWFTGKVIGDHIYAAIFGKSEHNAVAQAAPPGYDRPLRKEKPLDVKSKPSAAGQKNGDSETLSLLTPDVMVAHRVANSLYRSEEERDDDNAPAFHLRA